MDPDPVLRPTLHELEGLEDLRPVQSSVLGYRVNGRRQFLISLWHQRMIPVLKAT